MNTKSTRDGRNPITLYANILRTMGSGTRKGQIVYGRNLNFTRCGNYLKGLNKMKLIEIKTRSPLTWKITQRGQEFLEKYEELKRFSLPQ